MVTSIPASSVWTMPSVGVGIGTSGTLSPILSNSNLPDVLSGKSLVQSDSLLNAAIDRLTLTGAGSGGISPPAATADSSSTNPVLADSASAPVQAGTDAAAGYQSVEAQLQASEVSTLLGTSVPTFVSPPSNSTSSDGSSSSAMGSQDAASGYQMVEAQLQASEVTTLLGNSGLQPGIASNGMSDLLTASVTGKVKATVYGSIIKAKTSTSGTNQYA